MSILCLDTDSILTMMFYSDNYSWQVTRVVRVDSRGGKYSPSSLIQRF